MSLLLKTNEQKLLGVFVEFFLSLSLSLVGVGSFVEVGALAQKKAATALETGFVTSEKEQ